MKYINNNILPENLPGTLKKSFSMFFNGGEIWFEHLDGMYENEDLIKKKFLNDYKEFKKPSKPSLIAFVFDETVISYEIIKIISDVLLKGEKYFTRVVFVGLDKKSKKFFEKALNKDKHFALKFDDELENAKIWLTSEKY